MTPPSAAASTQHEARTWQPTRSEWETFVRAELDKLGISRDELERQARERDFQSTDALSLWMMVG